MHETHDPNYKHVIHYVNLNISKFVPYHYLSEIKCKRQVFLYFYTTFKPLVVGNSSLILSYVFNCFDCYSKQIKLPYYYFLLTEFWDVKIFILFEKIKVVFHQNFFNYTIPLNIKQYV